MVRASRRRLLVLGMIAGASALVGIGNGVARADGPPVDAKAAFEAMKGLVGTWEGQMEGQKFTVVYRLVGNGSTLVEEQFPGTSHAMITAYHLDGDDLRMTHYCAAGNQPRTKLDRAASTAADLVFAFDGGTNFDPAKDVHMHEMRLKLLGPDRITSAWTGYKAGRPDHTMAFELTRAAK